MLHFNLHLICLNYYFIILVLSLLFLYAFTANIHKIAVFGHVGRIRNAVNAAATSHFGTVELANYKSTRANTLKINIFKQKFV